MVSNICSPDPKKDANLKPSLPIEDVNGETHQKDVIRLMYTRRELVHEMHAYFSKCIFIFTFRHPGSPSRPNFENWWDRESLRPMDHPKDHRLSLVDWTSRV